MSPIEVPNDIVQVCDVGLSWGRRLMDQGYRAIINQVMLSDRADFLASGPQLAEPR
jgi:hypothetical protein